MGDPGAAGGEAGAGPFERPDVCVVGAGAAGLWVAARAAELGRRVLLLEKTPRTGTKVLASGGTRCNLTTTLDPEACGRAFGPRGARFLRTALRELPPLAVRARFADLGVPTVEAPLEKVFPASGRARDVRDALEGWARSAGVRIELGAGVREVGHEAGTWRVATEHGESLAVPRLILAPGGRSYPRTGTTGDGYAWLAALDLPRVPPAPALVPLRSPEAWVRELAGIDLQEVGVRLLDREGRELGRRDRPVVFSHAGLSGPGAMDLSEPVARAEPGAGLRLRLDLLPGRPREELRELLVEAARRGGRRSLTALVAHETGLARRLVERVRVQAGVPERRGIQELSRAERHALVETLRGLDVPVDGTLGYEAAEVTAGGLDLGAVDPGTLEVRGRPGLQVCGELLDLQGPIGGFNFQAAFATAELAARRAAR